MSRPTIVVPPRPPSESIHALRTPESAFDGTRRLFPYEPCYTEWGHLRIAYYDERSPVFDLTTASVVLERDIRSDEKVVEETWLLLHGEPTWSFLYRNMIPGLLQSRGRPHPKPSGDSSRVLIRRRVIAVDYLGFGRSDKPTSMADYDFYFHLNTLLHVVTQLDMQNITLVCQDWGGLVGLCVPLYVPGRFKRAVVMDTALPLGLPINEGFLKWKECATKEMEGNFIPSKGMRFMMKSSLDTMDQPGVSEGYDAPYPSWEYTAGAIKFPYMVPQDKSYPGTEIGELAGTFWSSGEGSKIPIFMAIGMRDLVIEPKVMYFLRNRYLVSTVATMEMPEAGHFVQEWGGRVVERALDVFEMMECEGVQLGKPGSGKGKL